MNTSHPQLVFNNTERTILVVLIGVAIVLGTLGYRDYFHSLNTTITMSDLAYLVINLFFMEFEAKGELPVSLDIARWLAPATLSYALIRTVMSLVQNKIQRLKLSYFKNHAVIIGLNDRTVNVALSFKQSGIKTVVIDSDEYNQYWGALKKEKIYDLVANFSDSNLLQAVNVTKAAYLFVCTDSDNTNLNLLFETFGLKQPLQHTIQLQSVCQITSQPFLHALNARNLFATNHKNMATRTFNTELVTARWLLNEFGPHKYIADISQLNTFSILITGTNSFTPELIKRLVEIGIYGCANKIRIIFANTNANEVCEQLKTTYPSMTTLIDLIAIVTPMKNKGHNYIKGLIEEFDPNIMYVCSTQTNEKLLILQQLSIAEKTIPIIVCETDNQSAFIWLENEFTHDKNMHFVNINTVMNHYDNIFENKLDEIAISIHNDYLAQQVLKGETIAHNSSLEEWDKLPEILKDANRNQADHIAIKCQYLTGSVCPSAAEVKSALTQETKTVLARMEHQRWIAEKKIAGWQYTEGEKSTPKKLSPSLLDWEELTKEEQQKDIDTVNQLPKLVALINSHKE